MYNKWVNIVTSPDVRSTSFHIFSIISDTIRQNPILQKYKYDTGVLCNYMLLLAYTGEVVEWPVVIKSKPLDSETATMINKMAQACGLELAVQYERHKLDTGFR